MISLEKVGGDAGIRTQIAGDERGLNGTQTLDCAEGGTRSGPPPSRIKSHEKSHDRLARAERFRQRESFHARRRVAFRRVEKALRTPTVVGALSPQVPPEAVGEAIRLTFFRRTGMATPWNPVGYPWTVDIPFSMSKPDIVRLLLVRHRLEQAKQGTAPNV